jgi:hypothetical protein
MNHGPMDVVLKSWFASWFPMLAGHAVVRIFVLLAPFVMLIAAYFARRSWTEALLCAGILTLLLDDVAVMMIVGRSDAALLCETVAACALTHGLLVTRHRHWTNGRAIALQIALGACCAAMFLTTWRVLPTIGTLVLLTLARQVSEANYRFWRTVFGSLGFFALGFMLVWLGVFVFELHGDFQLYFRHFFGFFMAESGWGTIAGARFNLFPPELVDAHLGVLTLTIALAVAALYRLRRERAQLIVWLILLPAGYVTYAYGYWKNQAGGGLHYFSAFFVTVWFLIVHGLRGRVHDLATRPWWRPAAQLAVVGAFAFFFNFHPLVTRGQDMQRLRAESKKFLKDVAARVGQEPVFGENTQLYKRKYMGEVVDIGDGADVFARSKYFGEGFTKVYERYLSDLEAHPPKYLMSALFVAWHMSDTTTKRFNELLHARYQLAIAGPATQTITNGMGATYLYERKD